MKTLGIGQKSGNVTYFGTMRRQANSDVVFELQSAIRVAQQHQGHRPWHEIVKLMLSSTAIYAGVNSQLSCMEHDELIAREQGKNIETTAFDNS